MQVLVYLEAFAAFYDLQPRIRYGRRVLRALPLPQAPLSDSSACGPRWRVTTCATSGPDQVCTATLCWEPHMTLCAAAVAVARVVW